MDERHLGVKESEMLSEQRIKQIVSIGIRRALQLEVVSPDIVFPVSGKWALEVSNLYVGMYVDCNSLHCLHREVGKEGGREREREREREGERERLLWQDMNALQCNPF